MSSSSESGHPATLEPGRILAGRFRIVRFLGRGGMGEVYEASDLELNQHVALKLIRPESRTDARLMSLLRDEVRKARSVSHTNVCRVYDLERDDEAGILFVTMELLRGESLQARLKRSGRFTPAEALPILRQIADGMEAIHARGLLHLDLKSANVLLESHDQYTRAAVSDFGLAESHVPKNSAETTDEMLHFKGGTPGYMAPERFLSTTPLTAAADVYSFGLVAYEMLAGSAWVGPPGVAPPALGPADWDAMVKGCLMPDPLERFASCGAALDSMVGPKQPASRRTRRLAMAGAVAAALAVTAAILWPVGPRASAGALRWYGEGVDAIREGTYYKAVRALDQAVKESPEYPLAHARLAEAWFELDSPERAQDELLRATGPGAPTYWSWSRNRKEIEAIHHTVTRNFAEAAKDYGKLAELASAAEKSRALVDLGRALERAKEPAKAMEQYEAAARLDPNYAGAHLRLAVIAGQMKNWDRSAQELGRAEALYEASSNLEGVTEVYYQRGANANRQGRPNDAVRSLERARQSAAATRNPHQEIRALQQLGGMAYQQGDAGAGQKFAEEAIQEARANNIEFLAGRGFIDLGNTLTTRGDFARATENFNTALGIARNYHNGKLEAMALYSLGSLGIRTRVDEAGAQQVQQALGWFETNRYPYEASLCLLTLGRFQRDRGDLVAAETSYRKQLELARETQDDFQTVAALSGVASILMRREKFPEALKVTQEQLEICRRMGNALQAAYAEASLADIYVELGRFDESAAASQNVEKAAKQGQMDELLAWMSATRTRALLLAGRYRDAAQSADDGLRTWEAMIRRRGRELLELQALAQTSAAPAARLALCERSRKIAQGSVAVELALNLTEAGFYLEAKDGRRALELAKALRGPLEKQGSDYSVFRAALIEATAMKQLGQNENDAASRASEALGRFQKQFEADGWERFRKRADFVYWENNLRQVNK